MLIGVDTAPAPSFPWNNRPSGQCFDTVLLSFYYGQVEEGHKKEHCRANAMTLASIEMPVQSPSNRASSAWINPKFGPQRGRHLGGGERALSRSRGQPVAHGGKPDPRAGDSDCNQLRLKQLAARCCGEQILFQPMSTEMTVYLDWTKEKRQGPY